MHSLNAIVALGQTPPRVVRAVFARVQRKFLATFEVSNALRKRDMSEAVGIGGP